MSRSNLPPRPLGSWLNATNITLVAFVMLIVFSASEVRGSDRDVDIIANLMRFFGRFFPPDWSVLGQTMNSLRETIQIAVMATFFAIFISLLIGIGASRSIAPRWLVISMRMLLNVIRTIPSLIWAVIAVAVFGANSLAGVVALTFYSIGYLGKFFSESIDSVDTATTRALLGMGADSVQAFQYGLWPQVKPLIWSHSIWMLEYNIRSASIIGYVGAGGLGFQLHTYQSFQQWDRFCTVLICILTVVTLLDFLSEWIRRKINPQSRNE